MLPWLPVPLLAQNQPPATPAAIPAINFFQLPDLTRPQLSPNGQYIGFVGRSNGHACVFLLDRSTGKIQGLFNPGEGQVEHFWWKGNRRVLVAGQGDDGLVYLVQELDSPQPRKIPGLKGIAVSCINPLPNDADHVIAFAGGYGRSVIKVDLRTGRGHDVETVPGGYNACVTSFDGELRAYTRRDGNKWKIAWRPSLNDPWHERTGKGDLLPFLPVSMDSDDRCLLVAAYDQGDTVAFMRLDPASDERTILVQYPDRDVWELDSHPFNRVPACATSLHFGKDDVVVLDDSARPFYASLTQSLPGTYNRWISSSADGSLRIIFSWSGRDPGSCYLFDGARKTLSPLGPCYSGLPASAMGEVRCFNFQTRDGVSESGYVILPERSGAGTAPPLMVVPPHSVGEPADCGNNFNGEYQFFVSRGFAVARFAVRGTFGFGREFEKAGDFQVNGRLAQDIEDGASYLSQAGLVDGRRTALLGFDSGGLIALRIAASSSLFRAVAVVDCWADFSIGDVGLLSSSSATTDVIIEQLGGSKATYKIVRQLDANVFLPSLSTPAFLAYSSWYDRTSDQAGKLRGVFDRLKKPYEWCELDVHDKKLTRAEYQADLYTRIAGFLKRTL